MKYRPKHCKFKFKLTVFQMLFLTNLLSTYFKFALQFKLNMYRSELYWNKV